MNRFFVAIVCCLLSTSCSTVQGLMGAPVDDVSEFSQSVGRERMLVRSGAISLEVEDLPAAVLGSEAAIAGLGGTLSSTSVGDGSAWLHARVPAEHLSAALDALARLGEELSRSTTATDVTDEYSDREAEIINLRSLRERLRTLLDRAKTVEDVLAVERELNRVQTKLDALESRHSRQSTDVRLSALSIQLAEQEPPRILGPLGLLYEGAYWLIVKMFVISP